MEGQSPAMSEVTRRQKNGEGLQTSSNGDQVRRGQVQCSAFMLRFHWMSSMGFAWTRSFMLLPSESNLTNCLDALSRIVPNDLVAALRCIAAMSPPSV